MHRITNEHLAVALICLAMLAIMSGGVAVVMTMALSYIAPAVAADVFFCGAALIMSGGVVLYLSEKL